MRIVFIGPFGLRPKATMSIRAVPLAKALAARGHAVTVLIPPWDDPSRAGQSWIEDGVQVVNVTLPGGIFRLPLFFHILLTRTLVARTLALKPEVIHCFKPKAYAGLAHLVLWWLRRLFGLSVRLVVDADDWEQGWNEVLPYTVVQKKFFAWQEQWGLRHADSVSVASRALADLVSTGLGRDTADIFYVPNGYHSQTTAVEPGPVDQGQPQAVAESPTVADPSADAPTILLYSRFVEFRLERIVSLVKMVADQLPQARWLIVGAGLQGEEKTLALKLAQANLANYVHFTGWASMGRVPAYFAAADVAVYPYDDTLLNCTKCSVKLISLLAAGLPVVADAVGQNCEYIESGVSGVLVPPENDIALAEAVVTLLQQAETRMKLGQIAGQTIPEKYNWSRLAQIVEKAYGL
ncbi:MAG: glycosyltransferase family 4 protein [Anaerolineae bacterium]|nr:glycosyltransferase family 4 protein [Anaerolineae bacterium]